MDCLGDIYGITPKNKMGNMDNHKKEEDCPWLKHILYVVLIFNFIIK